MKITKEKIIYFLILFSLNNLVFILFFYIFDNNKNLQITLLAEFIFLFSSIITYIYSFFKRNNNYNIYFATLSSSIIYIIYLIIFPIFYILNLIILKITNPFRKKIIW